MNYYADTQLISELHYTIEYDEQLHCAVLSWHGACDDTEQRRISEEFLNFVQQFQVSRIIHDVLIMNKTSAENSQWLAEDYVPRLVSAGVRYSAVVLPLRILDALALETLVCNVVNTEVLKTQYFSSLPAARDWFAGMDTASNG